MVKQTSREKGISAAMVMVPSGRNRQQGEKAGSVSRGVCERCLQSHPALGLNLNSWARFQPSINRAWWTDIMSLLLLKQRAALNKTAEPGACGKRQSPAGSV